MQYYEEDAGESTEPDVTRSETMNITTRFKYVTTVHLSKII